MIGRWIGNISDFVRNTLFCCAIATFLVLSFKGSRLATVLVSISVGVGVWVLIKKLKVIPESTLVVKILSDLKALWGASLRGDVDEVERRTRVLHYERDQLYDDEGIVLKLKWDFLVLPVVIGAIFGIVLWFLIQKGFNL